MAQCRRAHFCFVILFVSLWITCRFVRAQDCHGVNKVAPETVAVLQKIVIDSHQSGTPISLLGAGYSQGGQTCADNSLQLSLSKLDRLVDLDRKNNLVTVQTGMTWK
ncbi:MAG: FAD-binding protein, partial [Endozoicomonas sp.]